jgi:general secretion pathway protein D
MRSLQKDAQPKSSYVVPINEAPVMPPQRAPQAAPAATSEPAAPAVQPFHAPLAN